MANIKFSQFTETATPAGVQFLVGYNGAQNVRIAPGNIGGAFLPLAGGTLTGALIVDAAATVNDLLTAALGLSLTGGVVGSAKLVLASTNKVHLSGGTAGLILQNSAGTKSLTIDTLSTFAGDVNVTGSLAATVDLTAAVYKSPTGVSLKLDSNGATGAELVGNAANTKSGSIRFNCEQNTHGVTLIGPPHSASATYTLTLPTATGSAGQVLSTNGSGVLSFITAASGATSLNGLTDCLVDTASEYIGTVPAGLSGNPQGNTTLGINAGLDLTTGEDNVFLGQSAGESNTSGIRNIGIGSYSNFTSTNNYNIGIGYTANYAVTSPFVIGIGDNAFRVGSGGNGSIGIGSNAARANAAAYHLALGYQAGYSNTSGTNNTNVGYQAGFTNTTSGGNTYLGYETGRNVTGEQNVAIGYLSLKDAGTGFQNVAVGYASLQGSLNKFGNTAIGHSSGQYVVSNANTFLGNKAGQGDNGGASGFANVALGSGAYNNFTTGAGNIAIGYQCLLNGAHTGSNNVFVGRDILVSTAFTGSNSMALGYSAAPSSASASNEITLGNASVNLLRIPGLGNTDGHVLTFETASGGIVLKAAGGGGASYPFQIDTKSLYSGFVPASLSGAPQGNTILGIDAGESLTTGEVTL